MKKFLTLFIVIFFTSVFVAHAAIITLAPSAKTVTEGQTFSIFVEVNTKGKRVNAAETTVTFPQDLLEVVSVTGAKTFSLQTPDSPSRTQNSVSFSAGIPSPGYSGVHGGLGRILFRAKASGAARIAVSSGKVLLNDGEGTDVFSGTSNTLITIIPSEPKKEVPVETPAEVVPPPAVTETPAAAITPEQVPVTAPVVTPVQQPQAEVIAVKVSDLFRLIYVLLGIIISLSISIFILVIVLLKKNKYIKE